MISQFKWMKQKNFHLNDPNFLEKQCFKAKFLILLVNSFKVWERAIVYGYDSKMQERYFRFLIERE